MRNLLREVQLLRRWAAEGERDLQSYVRSARQDVRRTIQDALADVPNLASIREQRGVFRQLAEKWENLGQRIDDWALELAGKVAPRFREAAVADIMRQGAAGVRSRITPYSREFAERVFGLVAPENGKHIAAVFTDKMDSMTVSALRQSAISKIRQASVEGWTGQRIHKEIQEAWGMIAGDMGAYKFVDVAGRQWDNARYLNMLVRTTTARIARESFNQTLTDAGLDLIRFRNVGDSCPVCKAWDGVIISVSGADKRFPSYQEAINGGAWHPNCDCIQDYVDETLDADAITAQGETENVNWRDPEAVAGYREAWS